MKNIIKKLAAIIALSSFVFGLQTPKNHIVTTDWLAQNIGNKNLVIIDTRTPKEYKKSHIQGSINFPKKTYFQGKLGTVPKLPNTPLQMQEMLQKAGVSEDSMIVFYSAGTKNKDFADAASGIWNTYLYGITNTALLNGGIAKWISEGKAVTSKVPTIEPSDIELESFDKSIIASMNDLIESIYDEDKQISDSRVAKFYMGEDDRKDLARHGRIPTAKLTPMIRYTKNSGKYFEFLDVKEAKSILYNSGYGVELDKDLIIYCNTGHKARGLWFVTKFLLGMENVKVYDGGIVEYSRTAMPMESGEAMD
jgi:thiosulfate/3-mercaptopyruvate sulfurtransferase